MMKKTKKEILVFGSLLFLMSGSGAALAQNCTSPTRCDELGYTFSAEDCEGIRSLICPFDSSKYFCVEVGDPAANATPGMILYSDGTVSNEVISDKTAVGVVAYVAGSTRFAVALEENSSLEWSTSTNENLSCLIDYDGMAEAQTDFRGAMNMSCIINYSITRSYPAAEYCNSYKPVLSGKGGSGWYLPAAGELYVTSFSYEAINSGLQKLSKTQLQNDYYWSSSEVYGYNGRAWDVRPSDGNMEFRYKDNYYRVRCFLAF